MNRHYNAPYFSSADPEDRNNKQFAGSLSHFFTNSATGRHDLKAGFEHFTSFRNGGNSQSATGYVFRTDYLLGPDGRPLIVDDEPVPIWGGNAVTPGSAITRLENWVSVPGATIEIKTFSIYAQDRWSAGDRLTFDLGVRYEKVRTDATGGIVGADTDTLVPRLGLSFDVEGNGRTIAQATFAQYSGRYTERAFGRNTNVGTPSLVSLAYVGPNGSGMNFAPAFNLANYAVIGGNVPTANVFFDDNLSSPKTNELTLALGRELPNAGHVKGVYTYRTTSAFIEDVIADPTAAGKVTVPQTGGILDRVIWQNTDEQKREYQALQFMARVRIIDQLVADGHWTVQIKNHGSFEGEAANQPGNGSIWFDYPELFNEARYYPYGRLDEFQRHKVRLWTTLQPEPRALRQRRLLAALAHQLGTDLQPLHEQCRAVADTGCAQSRLCANRRHRHGRNAVLRRARQRKLRRVRCGRPGDQVRHSGLENAQTLGPAPDLQRLQQPEAHSVGYNRDAGSEQPAGRARTTHGIHPRRELRHRHRRRALPALVQR